MDKRDPGNQKALGSIPDSGDSVGARPLALAVALSLATVFLLSPVSTRTAAGALVGSDWTPATLPDGFSASTAYGGHEIACAPGTIFCVARGYKQKQTVWSPANLVTSDGGATWQTYQGFPPDLRATSVACPAELECWTLGDGNAPNTNGIYLLESTDGAQTWSDRTPASWSMPVDRKGNEPAWIPESLTCPSDLTCYVTGECCGINFAPGFEGTDASACSGIPPNWTNCPEVPVISVTHDGGDNWTTSSMMSWAPFDDRLPVPPTMTDSTEFFVLSISCASDLACVAVGGGLTVNDPAYVLTTSDGGASWYLSSDPILMGATQLDDVSCRPSGDSARLCDAIGYSVTGGDQGPGPVWLRSRDGGSTWKGRQFAETQGALNQISCPSSDVCWASEIPFWPNPSHSVLVGSGDGGVTLHPEYVDTVPKKPDLIAQGQGVTCASATTCIAIVNDSLWYTRDGGGMSLLSESNAMVLGPTGRRWASTASVTIPLPVVSPATVPVRAGSSLGSLTGQERISPALGAAVSVSVRTPSRSSSSSTRIRINGFFGSGLGGAAELGLSHVRFSISGAPVKVVTVHGFPGPPPTVSGLTPSGGSGEGGDTVTISGGNLAGATAVYFGPRRASHLQLQPDGSLTVTSPPGGSDVDVKVVTPSGGPSAATVLDHYAYGAPFLPKPVITAISPKAGPSGGGTWVEIDGQGVRWVDGVWFGRKQAATVRVLSDTAIDVRSPKHSSGTVNVRIMNAGGESNAKWFVYR